MSSGLRGSANWLPWWMGPSLAWWEGQIHPYLGTIKRMIRIRALSHRWIKKASKRINWKKKVTIWLIRQAFSLRASSLRSGRIRRGRARPVGVSLPWQALSRVRRVGGSKVSPRIKSMTMLNRGMWQRKHRHRFKSNPPWWALYNQPSLTKSCGRPWSRFGISMMKMAMAYWTSMRPRSSSMTTWKSLARARSSS